jgi:DNA helicase-2/ATP-dependent DNA helicase PcrA
MPLLSDIYRTYASRCFKANAMDFDDLLLNTNVLFRFPGCPCPLPGKFEYVLLMSIRYKLFATSDNQKAGCAHNNICVVGDDAQVFTPSGTGLRNMNSRTITAITSYSSSNKTTGRPGR